MSTMPAQSKETRRTRPVTTTELATEIRKQKLAERLPSMREAPTVEPATDDMPDNPTPEVEGYEVRSDGLYQMGKQGWAWLCSRFEIRGRTRNERSEDWGKLIHLWDPDGKLHKVVLSDAVLASERGEWCSQLQRHGLQVNPSRECKAALRAFLTKVKPEGRAQLVYRVGWHREHYLTPAWTIPQSAAEDVVFQDIGDFEHHFGQEGSLESWAQEVARLASGNALLTFAISCAFAAPLLPIKPGLGGGFHFASASSTGKSITLIAAGSVWGGGGKDGFVQGWDATSNGLEAIAASRNHCLLCLDELKQLPMEIAGSVAYKLANGQARARMNKDTLARTRAQWELIYLSTGEFGFVEYIKGKERRAYAGQEVRVCEVPADLGAYGSFHHIHGFSSPAQFAERISDAARQNYGTAGKTFVSEVAATGFRVVRGDVDAFMEHFDSLCGEAGADPAIDRILKRFALSAAAGELATAWGITSWQPGEAMQAASQCFQGFLARRGGRGSLDKRQCLEHLQRYINGNLHRFPEHSKGKLGHSPLPIAGALGYLEKLDSTKTELQIHEASIPTEMIGPFTRDLVMQVLRDQEALIQDMEAGRSRNPKRQHPQLGTTKRVRCLVIWLEKLLNVDDGSTENVG